MCVSTWSIYVGVMRQPDFLFFWYGCLHTYTYSSRKYGGGGGGGGRNCSFPQCWFVWWALFITALLKRDQTLISGGWQIVGNVCRGRHYTGIIRINFICVVFTSIIICLGIYNANHKLMKIDILFIKPVFLHFVRCVRQSWCCYFGPIGILDELFFLLSLLLSCY